MVSADLPVSIWNIIIYASVRSMWGCSSCNMPCSYPLIFLEECTYPMHTLSSLRHTVISQIWALPQKRFCHSNYFLYFCNRFQEPESCKQEKHCKRSPFIEISPKFKKNWGSEHICFRLIFMLFNSISSGVRVVPQWFVPVKVFGDTSMKTDMST